MKKECFVLYSSDYDYDELKKEYLEYCEANDLTNKTYYRKIKID